MDGPSVPVVAQQHVEEVGRLRHVRSVLTRAPHVGLLHLTRLDERIAAHFDGIAVAGEQGTRLCRQALASPGIGAVFTATTRAIESRDMTQLHKLLALADNSPEGRRGVLSAFGWVSGASLRGITKNLLESNDPWQREVGIAACAMHRVDLGVALLQRMIDGAADTLTARSLRLAVALGRTELRDACARLACSTPAPALALAGAAAYAAILLGDRLAAVDVLRARATRPGEERLSALSCWLKLAPNEEAHVALKALHADPASMRTLIHAIGVAGDPHHIPWLVARMDDLALTRLAGESFSLITGLDLALLDLDRKPPEGVETGPNDDPDDANVALDEDDSLPWPDPQKIAAWWHRNSSRFSAGTRYFMGHAPSTAHCFSVLQSGFQRQRHHAAEYLCLLQPGTPLFNIAAPAWRQKRLLAQMSVTDHTP